MKPERSQNSAYRRIRTGTLAGLLIPFLLTGTGTIAAQTVRTAWSGDAERIYEEGFARGVRMLPEGVGLFDMELVENDAPGAGMSERGVWRDTVWGRFRARKEFMLDDPRARKAWLVVFVAGQGKTPLELSVNGRAAKAENWDERVNGESCRWAEFPAAWLRKGRNVVELSCPGAAREEDGWSIQLARADEFEQGGGDPRDVGKTSFKSSDGGEFWKESPFGPLGQDRCEYSVRLSLDRHLPSGTLETPVIDLWRGDSPEFIAPLRMVRKVTVTAEAGVPSGTRVEYSLRRGTAPGPFSTEWEPWETVGSGAALALSLDGAAVNARYVQLRMALSTENPLVTPVIRSVRVEAEHQENFPAPANIRVLSAENPPVRYSSFPWEWESWDRPEFARLREWQNLDAVVEGSATGFEAQVRLMHHAIKQWIDGGVLPGFPEWNALDILQHIDRTGGGGMCLQNNLLLAGFLQSFGWQARHVNVISHEVCEVWNDEFGKWIQLDAHRANNYYYDPGTAEPMSVLDLHRAYLDKYFPDRPIDWMRDSFPLKTGDDVTPFAGRGSPSHHGGNRFDEYCRAAFVRMVPRANWFSRPYPRPPAHGMTQWPWDGYVNWYDDRTPPKRQYSTHTDRPRDLWPDLNTVHIDAVSGHGNDQLYLRFETNTPNFSHFETDANDSGWKKAGERWVWLLHSGRNTLRVRAVNLLGVKGKPSTVTLNYADAPFPE